MLISSATAIPLNVVIKSSIQKKPQRNELLRLLCGLCRNSGRSEVIGPPDILLPNRINTSFLLPFRHFRRVLFRKKCSPALLFPLFPPGPVPVMVKHVVKNRTAPVRRRQFAANLRERSYGNSVFSESQVIFRCVRKQKQCVSIKVHQKRNCLFVAFSFYGCYTANSDEKQKGGETFDKCLQRNIQGNPRGKMVEH